jgi:uncharacterized OB-fold protein
MLPPLPVPNADNQEFWDGCRRHELRIQRCADCGTTRFHPRPACPGCASLRFDWITCSGRGRVYTWTVVHAPTLPAFRERAPYAAGLIELDEKVFMVGEIRGVDPGEIRAGLRVRVAFDDVTAETSLPYWRP